MTLSQRNDVIKFSLALTLCLIVFALIAGVYLLTTKKSNLDMYTELLQPRSTSFFFNRLVNESISLFIVQNIAYPVYGFLILISIYFLFEKTYVIEISFFIFFAFLLSFESIKLLIPLLNLWHFAPLLVLLISQVLYCFRLTAVLLLLVAAIFIVTSFTRRIVPILFTVCFLALTITALTPFNTSIITPHFILTDGLPLLTNGAFWFFSIATVLTYVAAGQTLAAHEYMNAALGMLTLLIGYFFMLGKSCLLSFIAANFLFTIGCIFYIRSIHRYNLWQ